MFDLPVELITEIAFANAAIGEVGNYHPPAAQAPADEIVEFLAAQR